MLEPVTTSIRVRYAECDPMQVAHHSVYFVWFEAGRADFCRARGIDYIQMERDGLFLPVVEARCRYLSPARYDDDLLLTTRVMERKRRTLRIAYRLERDNTLIAEGETYQMLIDSKGRPRSWPEPIAALFTPESL